jgi:hypothetical protein
MVKSQSTETKYEWQFGEYSAETYCGEYGVHTDWFKNDKPIANNDVPDDVYEAHESKVEEALYG